MRHQRTIRKPVVLEGKGIHSGEDVRVKIKDAPADTGILFIRTDLKERPTIPATVANLAPYSGRSRCTSITKGGASVNTIEHLMAALGSLCVDNAEIEIDNAELPALDGSALEYARRLIEAGTSEQRCEKKELILKEEIVCRDKDASLTAVPARDFSVSYTLKYNGSEAMTQHADFSFSGSCDRGDMFIKELAPARTYCLESEIANIMKMGLGKGGNLNNALIIRGGRPVAGEFRFTNEPARHKILDLFGDLAILNVELKMRIKAVRSGHALNARFLRKLGEILYGQDKRCGVKSG